MVFAREINDPLTSLVKKLDAAVAKHNDCKMGSFVVFCNDEEGLPEKAKDLAEKEKLGKVILTVDNVQGPPSYKIAKDAEVTVVLYTKHQVKANYAFKKGDLKDKDIEKIVADLSKILPAKDGN
jgi:hypothetical protein